MPGSRQLAPLLTALAILALWAGTASANWTGTYTVSFGNAVAEDEQSSQCSNPRNDLLGREGNGPFGPDWELTSDQSTVGQASAKFAIPSGATLIGGSLAGSIQDASGHAGTFAFELLGANPPPWPSSPYACGDDTLGSGVVVSAAFANVGQWQAFSADGYPVFWDGWIYGGNASYVGAVPAWPDSQTGYGQYLALGTVSVRGQYAFAPAPVSTAVTPSGTGHDTTAAWSANGNDAGTVYTLQRETLGAGGVVQGWTTIYQGAATSYDTQGTPYAQTCGVSYRFQVAVVGPDNQTPWTQAPQWDEAPCAAAVSAGGSTTLDVSWPPGATGAGFAVYWCASSNCVQASMAVGSATAVQIGGLAPNTEYTVWVCGDSSAWGCPVYAAWTAANPPTGIAAATGGAAVWNAAVDWGADGNPDGTQYVLLRRTWSGTGLRQDWTEVYAGTRPTFATTDQTCGREYAYAAYAVNGAGVASAWNGSTYFENAPCTETITAPTSTQLDLTWLPSAPSAQEQGYTVIWKAAAGGSYNYAPAGAATSYTLAGLQPATSYSVWLSSGSGWWNAGSATATEANAPSAVGLADLTQTSLAATWAPNGNPPGTPYFAVVQSSSGGPWLAQSGWITATSWTATGLSPGTAYQISVEAASPSGETSPWTLVGAASTVPAAPANLRVADGGLGWSPTAGRGFVTLNWSPSPGATGYDVWVWDGAEYEGFDVGGATSWDSRAAAIYPPDAGLYPNVAEGTRTPPLLVHNGEGLDLRDRPLDLYCTAGTYYCSTVPSDNYWFGVSAYNSSGDSASFAPGGYACGQAGECAMPTLPLQTDPAPPAVTAWTVNGGGAYTYASSVAYDLAAAEGASGIAAYALSNDGSTWWTATLAGCSVGQAAPCQTTLNASGTWALLPGPGSKTVWAKVESAAGVWSTPQATTVYVNVDQTVPTVDVVLDGGAAATAQPAVTVAVAVTDPVSDQASLTWQARYSTDGGQTWSAWQAEGAQSSWTADWSVPGGAPGERTVLVQAENSDHNLGQGAAIIYYAPSGSGGTAALPPGAGDSGRACTWQVGGVLVNALCVTSSEVAVPLTPPAGAIEMRVSLDDVTWGPWQPTLDTLNLDLGAAPGAKTVWVEYQDQAGAVTAENPSYYVYDPGAPAVQAGWAGGASATDGSGHATLDLQAADPAGSDGLTVTVTENGALLYTGAYANAIALTVAGAGYQLVQVAVTNAAGTTTSTVLGVYAE